MKDYRRTKEFSELKKSLVDALAEKGNNDAVSRDKVEEYMAFWVRRRQLQDDISARGLSIADERGRVSENRSVSLEIQVSRQMLAIYQALGLQAAADRKSCSDILEDDDDEL